MICRMDNLGSKMKDSGPILTQKNKVWVRESVSVQESILVQELVLNQKIEIHIFFINGMWLSKIGGSISKSMVTGINVGLKNVSKLGKDTGVNIDSKIRIDSQSYKSGSHSCSSSIFLK